MAIYLDDQKKLIDSFEYFKTVFIDKKRCIFTNQIVYTKENIQEYRKQIIDNYDRTKRNSFSKYKDQINLGMQNTNTFKYFFSNIYYLYDLIRKTSEELKVNRLCFFLEADNKKFVNLNNIKDIQVAKILNEIKYDKTKVKSLMSTGSKIDSTAYNTNMYYEMNYIFGFFEQLLLNQNSDYQNILNSLRFDQVVNLNEPHTKEVNKFVARNYLLYLFYPDMYEPILSYKDKEKIVTFYKGSILKGSLQELDSDILEIRQSLGLKENEGFYDNQDWKNINISYNYKKRKNIENKIDDIKSDDLEDIQDGNERESIIKTRIGQSQFRKKLIEIYGKCCICGIANKDMLIASHIKPWSKSDSQEKTDYKSNGLLLCAQHDRLFDKGLITFLDAGKIKISSYIEETEYYLLNIEKNQKLNIVVNQKMKSYIQYHRTQRFKCKDIIND